MTSIRSTLLSAILFLSAGALMGQTPSEPQATPSFVDLVELIAEPHASSIRQLEDILDHGADPNLSGDNGRTLLHVAVIMAHISPTESLLLSGADPNRVDGEGKTPLQYVGEWNRNAIISALVRHGAKWPEMEFPQQLQDLEKRREALFKERGQWLGAFEEKSEELKKLRERGERYNVLLTTYYGKPGRDLRDKRLEFYNKMAHIDKQIARLNKVIEAEIGKSPDLREQVLRRHRHRMRADVFLLSWKDIFRRIAAGLPS